MNTNNLMIVRKNKTYLGTVPGSMRKVGDEIVTDDNIDYVATAVKNIEQLGYTVSKNVIECLRQTHKGAIVKWYKSTVKAIKDSRGGRVRHRPMYKGFPDEVMEASDAKLYIDQMMHYLGKAVGIRIMPVSEDVERFPLIDKKELTVLELATDKDVEDLVFNIINSNTSISDSDKKIIEWYYTDFRMYNVVTAPSKIPNKENMCITCKCLYECGVSDYIYYILHTATDILRFAVALSDGDVSLAEKTKFRSFRRPERRLILDMLNGLGTSALEDMFRHRNAWLRLGERLHPGDYANAAPSAYGCFTWLRNDKFRSFNSDIETLIANGDVKTAAKKLTERPGEFARRLDKLLRESNGNTVMNLFDSVADKVSTPVLIQVRDHFMNRNRDLPRFAIPKGPVAKINVYPKPEGEVDDYTTEAMVSICEAALMNKFKKQGKMGKVYIDPSMKNFLLPTAQRSSNESLLQVSRGSKFDIGDGNNLRFFLYWKGSGDIDLSAGFFDEDWNSLSHISYTNLRMSEIGAVHSGDITSAPDGASEFIDVDMEKARSKGIRYIALNVFVYAGTTFDQMEDCFCGWMTRENYTGRIFEEKTVQNKIDITTAARTVMPAIFDIVEGKVIWVDMTFGQSQWNNLEGNSTKIKIVGDVFTKFEKMNLMHLFTLHAVARGATFVSREDADIVFAEDGSVRPYDLDVIASEYMA